MKKDPTGRKEGTRAAQISFDVLSFAAQVRATLKPIRIRPSNDGGLYGCFWYDLGETASQGLKHEKCAQLLCCAD